MTGADWIALSEDEQLELIEEASMDGACEVVCKPSCYDCGCEVEPDGRCQHGCRSLLLVAGVM